MKNKAFPISMTVLWGMVFGSAMHSLTISIPLGMVIVCSIGVAIADNFFPEIGKLSYDGYASVGLGVMMILSSRFYRYGAEVCDGKAPLENIEHAES